MNIIKMVMMIMMMMIIITIIKIIIIIISYVPHYDKVLRNVQLILKKWIIY